MATDINWIIRATDQTKAAFTSIDQNINRIASGFKAIGAFTGFAVLSAGVTRMASDLLTLSSDLQDASDKLGINAESLQFLKVSAEEAGGSFEGLQSGLQYLTKLTGEAARGNEAAAKTFRLLGIDAKAFAQLSIEKRFAVLADQVSKVDDPAQRLELTLKALGRGGADLAPLLAKSADELAHLEDRFREVNGVIGQEQVKKLDELGEAWERFTNRALVGTAPLLTGTIEGFEGLIDVVKRYSAALMDDNLYLTNDGFRIGKGGKGRPGGGRGNSPSRDLSAAEMAAIAGEANPSLPGGGTKDIKEKVKASKELLSISDALHKQFLDDFDPAPVREFAGELESVGDYSARIFERTRTPFEEFMANMDKAHKALDQGMDPELYNRAVEMYQKQYASAAQNLVAITDTAASQTDRLLEDILVATNGFARDLTDVFFDATGDIGDMFKDLAETIAKALFTDSVTDPLIRAVTGSLGIKLPGLASGGPVSAGSAYIVGERGPELFLPRASGAIVPNGALGGGSPIALTINVASVDPAGAANVIASQERLIVGMVRRAMGRAGARPMLA